jgi:hypothetical protein
MAEVLTEPARTTVTVDGQAARKLLPKAVGQRASVYVRPAGENTGLTLSGTLIGSDDSELTLEFSRSNYRGIGKLRGTRLEVTLEIDQLRYTFEAQCTNEAAPGGAPTLRVRRPVTMTLIDRRRSPRRRLRKRTEVSLSGLDENLEWCAQAVMLNLSTEGMACRLSAGDALRLELGQVLGVSFALHGRAQTCSSEESAALHGLKSAGSRGQKPAAQGEGRAAHRDIDASTTPFNMRARVSNVTEGGTPGQVVVGLAFVADDQLERNRTRLQQALTSAE